MYKFIVIGHELTYFILSSTKNDKIRNAKIFSGLTIWYLQNLLTTKLEFRIDDISVEFGVHICCPISLIWHYGLQIPPSISVAVNSYNQELCIITEFSVIMYKY